MIVFAFVGGEVESHAALAGLELLLWLRKTLNSWSAYRPLASAGLTDVSHLAQLLMTRLLCSNTLRYLALGFSASSCSSGMDSCYRISVAVPCKCLLSGSLNGESSVIRRNCQQNAEIKKLTYLKFLFFCQLGSYISWGLANHLLDMWGPSGSEVTHLHSGALSDVTASWLQSGWVCLCWHIVP